MGLEIIGIMKKEKGLTSEELSHQSGVPLGTLNKILSGATKDPKLETLKALARVLECSLDDFDDTSKIHTLAAHHNEEQWTEEELKELEWFKSVLKAKRTQSS